MDLGGLEGREDLGGVRRGETLIRTCYVRKVYFQKVELETNSTNHIVFFFVIYTNVYLHTRYPVNNCVFVYYINIYEYVITNWSGLSAFLPALSIL